MMRIKDALTIFSDHFDHKIAQHIVSTALKIPKADLFLSLNKPITQAQKERLKAILEKLLKGIPLDYAVGEKSFFDLQLQVTKDTLIPRVETELLVEKIVHRLKKCSKGNEIFLDLCCGSGCIGLAVKKHLPHLEVHLSDLCDKALKIAKTNAKENDLDVTFHQGDLLEPFVDKKFHYVACNPPYISEKDYNELDPSVKDFEPTQALLAGSSGLELYQKLSCQLPDHLHPFAKIFFEIGYNQGPEMIKIFSQTHWKQAIYEKDYSGNDRFFFLEFE